jgi:hypothetical protein
MLSREAIIQTKCPISGVSLHLDVGVDGLPSETSGVIHFAVPAAQWWDDIVHT